MLNEIKPKSMIKVQIKQRIRVIEPKLIIFCSNFHILAFDSTMSTENKSKEEYEYEYVSVKFTVESSMTAQQERPCTIYQEIRFAEPIDIEFITFRNFYCAYITIDKYIDSEWETILRKYQLMKNGHFENDAQNSHIIHQQQFIGNGNENEKENDISATTALRFYLIQPSSNWTSFGLRDLMCYTTIKKPKINLENQQNDTETIENTETIDDTKPQKLDIKNAALLFRQLANTEK